MTRTGLGYHALVVLMVGLTCSGFSGLDAAPIYIHHRHWDLALLRSKSYAKNHCSTLAVRCEVRPPAPCTACAHDVPLPFSVPLLASAPSLSLLPNTVLGTWHHCGHYVWLCPSSPHMTHLPLSLAFSIWACLDPVSFVDLDLLWLAC